MRHYLARTACLTFLLLGAALGEEAPAANDESKAAGEANAAGEESSSAGAAAMQAEIDEMQKVLDGAKRSLVDLNRLIDAQNAKLQAMKALAAQPGVACDNAVGAARRLSAMNAMAANARASMGMGGDSEVGGEGQLMTSARNLYYDKTVARRKEMWGDHLKLLSAIKVDGEVSALMVLPQSGGEGLARYIAVGDTHGRLYIFRPTGDLVIDHDCEANATTTSISAYLIRRNETLIITGHSNGAVHFHSASESIHHDPAFPDDMYVLSTSVIAKQTVSSATPQAAAAAGGAGAEATVGGGKGVPAQTRQTGAAVTVIEHYRINGKRYVAAADAMGTVAVFKENGKLLHGVFQANRPVVAFKTSNEVVAWVTDSGAGSADIMTMEMRSVTCQGLNSSLVAAAKFDSQVSSKMYVVTQDGELLIGFVSVDTTKFTCTMRNRRPLGLEVPATMASIKGYLFLSTPYDVSVLNTTAAGRKPPRDVLTEARAELAKAFGHVVMEQGSPLVSSNKQRQVAVAFPGGLVGCYESELPIFKPGEFNTKLWSQPLFVAAIVLVAIWQFYRQKGASAMGGMGGGMGGLGGLNHVGNFGEKAMKRPGYDDFDPKKFREEYLAGKYNRNK